MDEVIGGVDTHTQAHCAAVIDARGRLLGVRQFAASQAGYRELAAWMRSHGSIRRMGVEGTGAFGAGLTRHLRSEGVEVVEVPRPDRRSRRRWGKSDPIDAEAAARAVLAGTATIVPKGQDGLIEAIRALRVVRTRAIKAKTAATNSRRSMIVSAPEELRATLSGASGQGG
ncbi:MAG: transposase [Actinomycetota bacterium]